MPDQRLALTEKVITQLPPPAVGQYKVTGARKEPDRCLMLTFGKTPFARSHEERFEERQYRLSRVAFLCAIQHGWVSHSEKSCPRAIIDRTKGERERLRAP